MSLAMFARPLAVVLLTLALAPASLFAQAGRYDSFYVFGDSLADTGNVWLGAQAQRLDPAPPPSISPRTYFLGRFSNGPVAVEYLWQLVSGQAPGTVGALQPYVLCAQVRCSGSRAINFAFGGTGTPEVDVTPGGFRAPGLKGQIGLFASTVPQVSPRALFTIITGANDYREDAYNVPMAPKDVVAAIGDSITQLHQLGARNIVVFTLPDLGRLPYLTAEQAQTGSAVTRDHNDRLTQRVKQLRGKLSGLDLRLVDTNVVFTLLRAVIGAQPAPPGTPSPLWALPALDAMLLPFPSPVTGEPVPMSACLFVDPSRCGDVPLVNADGTLGTPFPLLFWDIVHPTTQVHQALALYTYAQLAR